MQGGGLARTRTLPPGRADTRRGSGEPGVGVARRSPCCRSCECALVLTRLCPRRGGGAPNPVGCLPCKRRRIKIIKEPPKPVPRPVFGEVGRCACVRVRACVRACVLYQCIYTCIYTYTHRHTDPHTHTRTHIHCSGPAEGPGWAFVSTLGIDAVLSLSVCVCAGVFQGD